MRILPDITPWNLFDMKVLGYDRGDIAGALVTILENAPYGPNVDEAKVRTTLPRDTLH